MCKLVFFNFTYILVSKARCTMEYCISFFISVAYTFINPLLQYYLSEMFLKNILLAKLSNCIWSLIRGLLENSRFNFPQLTFGVLSHSLQSAAPLSAMITLNRKSCLLELFFPLEMPILSSLSKTVKMEILVLVYISLQ